jgi:hypothetical protein
MEGVTPTDNLLENSEFCLKRMDMHNKLCF